MPLKTTLRDLIYAIPGAKVSYRWMYRQVKAVFHIRDEFAAARALMRMGDEGRLLDGLSNEEQAYWRRRTEKVLSDPSNQHIRRHLKAGRIAGRWLVMHNGLRVDPLGHYGKPMLEVMVRNRGVHEPEEERAFQYVLADLPDKPVMIELGSYWAFYSMWFLKKTRKGRAFLVEPFSLHIESGKKNFRRNGCVGDFTIGCIGKLDAPGVPSIRIDEFAGSRGLSNIDILHSDIQGAEHEMLLTAPELLAKQRISFLFISTHRNDIHRDCVCFLKKHGYNVVRDTDLDATTSEDGLILACSQHVMKNAKLIQMLQF
jgi:hypothetical protein